MLNVYQSNRLEALVTVLANQLKISSDINILKPETILVQSPGMAQWLKLEIARANGIAANLTFPLPSSFIWRLYQKTMPDIPEQSPYNKDRMTWVLFTLLPEFLENEAFFELQRFLSKSELTFNVNQQQDYYQLRLFQLAEKIADVFDNYLMYRPHWLAYWQQGENGLPDETLEGNQWQAILWRAVVTFVESRFSNLDTLPALHRAEMQQALLRLLNSITSDQVIELLGPRVSVFGISTIAEQQIEVFEALGQHIEIDIYWFNPCRQFWGDVVSPKVLAKLNAQQIDAVKANTEFAEQYYVVGNPLLASWGKVGKDYLDLLTNKEVALYDIFIEVTDQRLSVLERVQKDILELEFRTSQTPLSPRQLHSDFGKRVWPSGDKSIQVHACHSRLRELEVLKDNLLALLSDDVELLPSDILVMMPDVNVYSPFIDVVFGGIQKNQYIPYTVADKFGSELSPSLNAFVELLNIPNSRFSITDILDLIEVPFVSRLFEMDDEDLQLIRDWVQGSQIKWGIDGQHKANWQLPNRDLNTWSNGIKRMLLGVVIGEEANWHDIVPFAEIEGMQAKTVGKLINFFNFTVELKNQLEVQRPVAQWQQFVKALLEQCFELHQLEDIEQYVLLSVREANETLLDYANELQIADNVSYKLIHRHFSSVLQEDGVTQRFLAGKLNFCSLMPMRSVPFKVICVLGLNESEYPKVVEPVSFDLVTQFTPRKGDRSRKWDERYLLLEALCSARNLFYLSYVGYSLKNNDELPPSVLLSELDDYLNSAFINDVNVDQADENKRFPNYKYHHKLQPFDPEYFQSSTPFTLSYNQRWYDIASQATQTQTQLIGNEAQQYEIQQDKAQQDTASERFSDADSFLSWRNSISLEPNLAVDLDLLVSFWQNPIKGFYKQQLDVRFETYTEHLSDVENFSHDGLAQYQLKDTFIRAALNQQTIDKNILLHEGVFPTDLWGEKKFKEYANTASSYISSLKPVLQLEENQSINKSPLAIQYKSVLSTVESPKELLIDGQVDLYNGHYVHIRAGKVRPVDIVSCWITHLIINSSHKPTHSMVFGFDGAPKWFGFPPMEQATCDQLLQDWLIIYADATVNKQLLRWHTETAFEWLKAKEAGKSEVALEMLLKSALAFDGNNNYIGKEDYSWRYFSTLTDFTSEFFTLATQLLQPILDHGKIGNSKTFKKYMEYIYTTNEVAANE